MPPTRTIIAVLFVFLSVIVLIAVTPANRAWGKQQDAPSLQDATAYPPVIETGYPVDATTPPDQGYPNPGQPTVTEAFPTDVGTTRTLIPSPTSNPLTPSPTAGRDLFGTEDSEMGNSKVTPPASETPQPSPTPTPSVTPSATPELLQRFHLNRQFFTLGFLLPLGLLILGWVGYRMFRTGEFKAN